MKRTIVLAAIACIVMPAATSALGREKAHYVGGHFASVRLKASGTLFKDATDVVVFTPDKKGEPQLRVTYGAITALDYSERAGQGLGVSMRLTSEAGLLEEWAALSEPDLERWIREQAGRRFQAR